MCGIAGVYQYRGSQAVERAVLARMRDSMVHRGPDGHGEWISADQRVGLAHRRLAIVDLNPNAAQPMKNEDGSVWITFNGEIYNHAGLRQELLAAGHTYITEHSDTESLIHGYEQWGLEGLLSRLSGDYALAIWDANSRVLSIARDRVGVKPLYFSFQNGGFLFASEIKAILEHPSVERDIDPSAMYHYLSFLTTPAPMTMFKGIYKLPAGYCAQIDANGNFTAHRYWDAVPGHGIDPSDTKGLSDSALEHFYVDGIRSRLRHAVEERMMSDVPFGVFLSGGIDSSTNVALMAELMDRPVDTFTVGFKDHTHLNELEYADAIAKRFNTNHHQVLIDEGDMIGYLGDLIHHQDEPLADWVCIPLYFVSKLARDNGVTVIQVGEGSDEQFCGYASYMGYLELYHRYWSPFRKFLPKFAQKGVAAAARTAAGVKPSLQVYADIITRAADDREHFWSGAMTFWELGKKNLLRQGSFSEQEVPAELRESGLLPESYLQQDTFNVVESFLGHFDREFPGRDALTRMIYNEFRLRLPELLLMRVDKITMSTSLESRVPFLAHRLVEFSMDIPEEWKTRNGTAKYLLKKAVEGIIPDDIIYRKKMGFAAPMAQWLRSDFGKHAESALMSSRLLERGFFDRAYIASLFRKHRTGKTDCSLYIWTLFNLTSWYDYWIEKRAAQAA
jgi:asparagine synthase (glutamine-hydrolysing)